MFVDSEIHKSRIETTTSKLPNIDIETTIRVSNEISRLKSNLGKVTTELSMANLQIADLANENSTLKHQKETLANSLAALSKHSMRTIKYE